MPKWCLIGSILKKISISKLTHLKKQIQGHFRLEFKEDSS